METPKDYNYNVCSKGMIYRSREVYIHVLMRDAEGRKTEASKVKQTTRQSNTAHPRQSLHVRVSHQMSDPIDEVVAQWQSHEELATGPQDGVV